MATNDTLWTLEPHTVGKHLVLKAYFQAWLPVMSKFNEKLSIIDGFAGPGEYEGGDLGSPQILLDTHLKHFYQAKMSCHTRYYFLEKNERRHAHLRKILDEKYATLPQNISVDHARDDFANRLSGIINEIKGKSRELGPCFAMVDPFGVSDTPMSAIKQLLQHPKSEVYISVMYEHINRFKGSDEFEPHLDALFGCEQWREAKDIVDKIQRRTFLSDLYKHQLKLAGAKQVLHFELYNGNRHIYTIFFATQHFKGSDKMKSAIWKVVPDGSFKFRGGMQNAELDLRVMDYSTLHKALYDFFGSQFVTIEQVMAYIGSDATDFPTDRIKTAYLKPFEKRGLIKADPNSRKTNLTYPNGVRLQFVM